MKLKNIILAGIIIGNFMPIYLLADQQPIKIRTLFNIKHAYCAIKTNGIKGLDNRKSAYAGRGGGISSTNSLLFLENGENEISLEIGALNWFSEDNQSVRLNEAFSQQSGCKLDLVKFTGDNKDTLLSIDVTINSNGKPIAKGRNNIAITKKLAQQVEPGHIDPNFFNPHYFPKGMELYEFSKKINLTGIPHWEWVDATKFTGSDSQLNDLRSAYEELADIINRDDREKLKENHRIVLKAWSIATGSTEEEIFESQYPSRGNGSANIKIDPINWSDYAVRSMNNDRIIQLYNKSKPTYSPLSYHYKNEDNTEHMGSISPMFSLINGKFVPVI